MKVFDLACEQGHRFEGWFASDDDRRSQAERGLLTCPLCGNSQVSRRPSAPRLNLQTPRGETVRSQAPADERRTAALVDERSSRPGLEPSAASSDPSASAPLSPEAAQRLQALQGAYVAVVRQVLSQTEDVGAGFAEEARRIHYGEAPSRGIRGQSSSEDLEALRDEGIEVVSLPIPPGLDQPIH